ncbi:hypothetical protein ACI78V_14545 [Geodermatophilus sp. SYSU D00742]
MVSTENGGVVVPMPLPAGVPLQTIAVAGIGAVTAAVLLDPARVPGGSIEIGGDERLGAYRADSAATRAGAPACAMSPPGSPVAAGVAERGKERDVDPDARARAAVEPVLRRCGRALCATGTCRVGRRA